MAFWKKCSLHSPSLSGERWRWWYTGDQRVEYKRILLQFIQRGETSSSWTRDMKERVSQISIWANYHEKRTEKMKERETGSISGSITKKRLRMMFRWGKKLILFIFWFPSPKRGKKGSKKRERYQRWWKKRRSSTWWRWSSPGVPGSSDLRLFLTPTDPLLSFLPQKILSHDTKRNKY